MAQVTRRHVLQRLGGGTIAAGSGGLAVIFASGRAPAVAQGTTVHWLKFVDFVPVSDQLIKGKLKDECKKALGVELIAEMIDGNGIQARNDVGDPVWKRPRHHHGDQQLGAALR